MVVIEYVDKVGTIPVPASAVRGRGLESALVAHGVGVYSIQLGEASAIAPGLAEDIRAGKHVLLQLPGEPGTRRAFGYVLPALPEPPGVEAKRAELSRIIDACVQVHDPGWWTRENYLLRCDALETIRAFLSRLGKRCSFVEMNESPIRACRQ